MQPKTTRDGRLHAIRCGTALAPLLLACMAAPVAAQTSAVAPPPTPTSAEGSGEPTGNGEVVVTGSRIARAGFNAPTPTTVLGADELAKRGFTGC